MVKASHLTAFCAWDSSPHFQVTPAQLMSPKTCPVQLVTLHNYASLLSERCGWVFMHVWKVSTVQKSNHWVIIHSTQPVGRTNCFFFKDQFFQMDIAILLPVITKQLFYVGLYKCLPTLAKKCAKLVSTLNDDAVKGTKSKHNIYLINKKNLYNTPDKR